MTIRPATPLHMPQMHVDQQLDPVDGDAGETRRRFVAADREHLPAEDRPVQDKGRNHDDRQHDPDLERHAKNTANGNGLELRNLEHLQVAVGRNLRDAAAGDEQHKRCNDRLNLEAA